MLDAMIFDVDGTLVDTNPAHVEAWHKALEDNGFQIPPARLAPEIGKGGDNLLPSLLGKLDEAVTQKLNDSYSEHFLKIAAQRHFDIIPGARELVAELKNRGVRTALATSGKKENLQAISKSCGWAIADDFDVVVTGDEAENSKPKPDLVNLTVEKLGLSSAQCALIGDTPHDAEACRPAGVVCLGVLSGNLGNSETMLRDAGARKVYANCAAMLKELDKVLYAASPAPISLDTPLLERLMDEALQVAADGMKSGEAPIGCVLASGKGDIIARGFNTMNASQMKIAHAEIVTFQNAAGKVPLDAKDLILVSTLEPCVMCLGAAMEAAVETVVYALEAPYDGGTQRVAPPRSPEAQMPRIVPQLRRSPSRRLFEQWLQQNADSDQKAFIESLLEATK